MRRTDSLQEERWSDDAERKSCLLEKHHPPQPPRLLLPCVIRQAGGFGTYLFRSIECDHTTSYDGRTTADRYVNDPASERSSASHQEPLPNRKVTGHCGRTGEGDAAQWVFADASALSRDHGTSPHPIEIRNRRPRAETARSGGWDFRAALRRPARARPNSRAVAEPFVGAIGGYQGYIRIQNP